jgi:hypothetical protein
MNKKFVYQVGNNKKVIVEKCLVFMLNVCLGALLLHGVTLR